MKPIKTQILKRLSFPLVLALIFTIGLFPVGTLRGADAESSEYSARTATDVDVPTNELLWLLNPLTKDELIVEADAWLDLLKLNVEKISAAEISVKRHNDRIEKAKEAAAATEEAIDAAADATATQQDAQAGDDAAEATQEALQKAAEAQQAVDELREAKKTAEADEIIQTAVQVVEQVQETEPVDAASTDEVVAVVELVDVDTNRVATTDELTTVIDAVNAQVELSQKEKNDLLEVLPALRAQQTALVDRLNVVLDELKAKGGEIEAYELYRNAIGKLEIDVTDTSALWAFVKGWLETTGVKWGINILKFFVIIALFYFLSRGVGKAVDKTMRSSRKMSHLLRDFIKVFSRRGVFAIGILIAVSSVGVSITPLLAIITAAGLVIGLALQGTLSNFASGLLLLFYRPFDVGDAIDAGGTAGSVDSMNLMSTIIRTWDNKVMIVPNNGIWGNIITNISRTSRRRVDLVFGIGYSDSIDKAQKILEKILADHPDVLEEPAPLVRLHELADSSVNFVVRPWVLPANYWEVYWTITRRVKEEFDAQGVSIPFPQRDVHMISENNDASATPPAVTASADAGSKKPNARELPKESRLEADED